MKHVNLDIACSFLRQILSTQWIIVVLVFSGECYFVFCQRIS